MDSHLAAMGKLLPGHLNILHTRHLLNSRRHRRRNAPVRFVSTVLATLPITITHSRDCTTVVTTLDRL